MSETAARAASAAGDDNSATSTADGREQRAAQPTAEQAEKGATEMYAHRAEGPHATELTIAAGRPTPKESITAFVR